MARDRRVVEAVERAYGVQQLLDHSRWAKVLNSGQVSAPRRCTGCGDVLTEGHDPNDMEVAVHQYDKLREAGMIWEKSPAE